MTGVQTCALPIFSQVKSGYIPSIINSTSIRDFERNSFSLMTISRIVVTCQIDANMRFIRDAGLTFLRWSQHWLIGPLSLQCFCAGDGSVERGMGHVEVVVLSGWSGTYQPGMSSVTLHLKHFCFSIGPEFVTSSLGSLAEARNSQTGSLPVRRC